MKIRLLISSALLASSVLLCLSSRAQDEAGAQLEDPATQTSPEVNVQGSGDSGVSQSTNEPIPDAPVKSTEVEVGTGGAEPTGMERRLFRIFKNNPPVPQQKWDEIVGNRRQEVYSVQQGDTLWDISQTLFGDGNFWTKLWAENSTLENPHLIIPGRQIQLVAGSESSAPSITVGKDGGNGEPVPEGEADVMLTENDATTGGLVTGREKAKPIKGGARPPVYREEALESLTPEELATGNNIEVDELIPKPELPPEKNRHSVVTKLPPSFVAKIEAKRGEYDQTGLDAHLSKSLTTAARVIPNSFLADRTPDDVGTVKEVEAQEKTASFDQYVFLKLKSKVNIGDRFSVIYPKDKVQLKPKGEIGPVIEIEGRVEIVDVVNEHDNVYRGIVIQAINPIRIGALLTSEQLPRVSYSRKGTRTTVISTIIGGEYAEDRTMLGENAVVYLDLGQKGGVNVGDIVPIQSARRSHRDTSAYPNYTKSIGLIKIFNVGDKVATGVILQADEEVLVGDKTGGMLTPTHKFTEEAQDADRTDTTTDTAEDKKLDL